MPFDSSPEKSFRPAAKTESAEPSGQEIVRRTNEIRSSLRTIRLYAEEIDGESQKFEHLIRTVREERDRDPAAFLADLKKYETVAKELTHPAITSLANVQNEKIREKIDWEKTGADSLRHAVAEALTPEVLTGDLRVRDHFLNITKFFLAAMPEFSSRLSSLTKLQTFEDGLRTAPITALQNAYAGLRPELKELVRQGVKNQLGFAAEVFWDTLVDARRAGFEVPLGKNPQEEMSASQAIFETIAKWRDTAFFLGRLVDPDFKPWEPKRPENTTTPGGSNRTAPKIDKIYF